MTVTCDVKQNAKIKAWSNAAMNVTCDMTCSHVCHDSFTCVTWIIVMCAFTPSSAATWRPARTLTSTLPSHDAFMCVPWLIHMSAMTHSFICHTASTRRWRRDGRGEGGGDLCKFHGVVEFTRRVIFWREKASHDFFEAEKTEEHPDENAAYNECQRKQHWLTHYPPAKVTSHVWMSHVMHTRTHTHVKASWHAHEYATYEKGQRK